MTKDFELEEERRRMAFLQAESDAIENHEASTKISLLYRAKKARRLVSTKRHQIALEKVMVAAMNFDKQWIPLQKLVRNFLTRCWFLKRGVAFKINRKKKKKRVKALAGQEAKITFDEICSRVEFETKQRRVNARNHLFYTLYDKFVESTSLLETNIVHWVINTAALLPYEIIIMLCFAYENLHIYIFFSVFD